MSNTPISMKPFKTLTLSLFLASSVYGAASSGIRGVRAAAYLDGLSLVHENPSSPLSLGRRDPLLEALQRGRTFNARELQDAYEGSIVQGLLAAAAEAENGAGVEEEPLPRPIPVSPELFGERARRLLRGAHLPLEDRTPCESFPEYRNLAHMTPQDWRAFGKKWDEFNQETLELRRECLEALRICEQKKTNTRLSKQGQEQVKETYAANLKTHLGSILTRLRIAQQKQDALSSDLDPCLVGGRGLKFAQSRPDMTVLDSDIIMIGEAKLTFAELLEDQPKAYQALHDAWHAFLITRFNYSLHHNIPKAIATEALSHRLVHHLTVGTGILSAEDLMTNIEEASKAYGEVMVRATLHLAKHAKLAGVPEDILKKLSHTSSVNPSIPTPPESDEARIMSAHTAAQTNVAYMNRLGELARDTDTLHAIRESGGKVTHEQCKQILGLLHFFHNQACEKTGQYPQASEDMPRIVGEIGTGLMGFYTHHDTNPSHNPPFMRIYNHLYPEIVFNIKTFDIGHAARSLYNLSRAIHMDHQDIIDFIANSDGIQTITKPFFERLQKSLLQTFPNMNISAPGDQSMESIVNNMIKLIEVHTLHMSQELDRVLSEYNKAENYRELLTVYLFNVQSAFYALLTESRVTEFQAFFEHYTTHVLPSPEYQAFLRKEEGSMAVATAAPAATAIKKTGKKDGKAPVAAAAAASPVDPSEMLEKTQAQLRLTQQQVQDLERELKKTQNKLASKTEETQRSLDEMAVIRRQISTLQEKYSQAMNKLHQAKANHEETRTKVETEKAEIQAKYDALLAKQEKERRARAQEKRTHIEQVAALIAEKEAHLREIEAMNNELESARAEATAAKTERDQARMERDETRAQQAPLKAELEIMRRRMHAIEAAIKLRRDGESVIAAVEQA